MQIKIEKSGGKSVIISDVTAVTILSTESECLVFRDGRTEVRTSPPLTFTDIATVYRTSKEPMG